MRCGDCGETITEAIPFGRRQDVCNGCWDNRDWLLKNRVVIGMAAFQKVQKSMAHKTGKAKGQIEKLKREV